MRTRTVLRGMSSVGCDAGDMAAGAEAVSGPGDATALLPSGQKTRNQEEGDAALVTHVVELPEAPAGPGWRRPICGSTPAIKRAMLLRCRSTTSSATAMQVT